MMRMGVWTENLSLPVVLNECMLQSYSGIIRIFPNTKGLGPVRFRNLRAVGAFLVSGAWNGTTVTTVSIFSEKGSDVRLANPWGTGQVRIVRARDGRTVPVRKEGDIHLFGTDAGATYRVERVL